MIDAPTEPDDRCRHCRIRKRSRARGLCQACSYLPEIRAMYPGSTAKFARRGAALDNVEPDVDRNPTPAMPGSPEKVAVMIDRVARGLSPWHPSDGRV